MLLPVVVGTCVVAFTLGGWIEGRLLSGDYRGWLLATLGLGYDQRNSLVVGIAMGFAVIPIIFTIAEDSLANVPQHLRAGSLAMGATRWQTAVRIVLPTASPGIFSAVMIGFGRAVGETMIVLMATGNTPVMDANIFSGFRALSANIAVELPEAPEGGTLFRILFLAAFLLFCLTFAVNTVAEVVRLKLRQRYRYL
jgi:phosphate transport system permease protein